MVGLGRVVVVVIVEVELELELVAVAVFEQAFAEAVCGSKKNGHVAFAAAEVRDGTLVVVVAAAGEEDVSSYCC